MKNGSVRAFDHGWGYRIDVGADPVTKRRRQVSKQGFATKRDAEQALRELVVSRARSRGNGAPSREETLGAFLGGWLVLHTAHLRPSTRHSYGMAVERLTRGLGSIAMRKLSTLQIERFYGELLSSGRRGGGGLAPKTVRNTHIVLRKALSDAERFGLVETNPAARAHSPVGTPHEFLTWTSEEIKHFLDSVSSDRLFAAWVLLATTGMRRGEVIGLRWRDIDLANRELSISNTLTTAGSGTVVAGPPKTSSSRRHIFLDDGTIEILRAHHRTQTKDAHSAESKWKDSNSFVFTDEHGDSIEPDLVSRMFRRHVRAATLPPIRLHDVRHTYATLALKSGVHPKVVSERLGHSTIAITLDLYSHVTPSISRDAADVVARQILPTSTADR